MKTYPALVLEDRAVRLIASCSDITKVVFLMLRLPHDEDELCRISHLLNIANESLTEARELIAARQKGAL